MTQKPVSDLTKMSPPEFAQYVMQADVGEKMIYMRKRQGAAFRPSVSTCTGSLVPVLNCQFGRKSAVKGWKDKLAQKGLGNLILFLGRSNLYFDQALIC